MSAKTAKLTAPNGAAVVVAADVADELLRRGFTREGTTKKAPAKKAAPTKSNKS